MIWLHSGGSRYHRCVGKLLSLLHGLHDLTEGLRLLRGSDLAREAGRGKGSIKRSRAIFADIVAAIEEAALVPVTAEMDLLANVHKAKDQAAKYRRLYEESIAREIHLSKRTMS